MVLGAATAAEAAAKVVNQPAIGRKTTTITEKTTKKGKKTTIKESGIQVRAIDIVVGGTVVAVALFLKLEKDKKDDSIVPDLLGLTGPGAALKLLGF